MDPNTLLAQINNDKATISRAMGQNKQLKDHLLELQDKLMKTSETNATLANEVKLYTGVHFITVISTTVTTVYNNTRYFTLLNQ